MVVGKQIEVVGAEKYKRVGGDKQMRMVDFEITRFVVHFPLESRLVAFA